MALGKIASAQKQKLSIRLPEKMLADVNYILAQDGESIKNRSAWISQALIDLKNMPNYIELILEEWIARSNNKIVQITLSNNANHALDDMKKEVGAANKKKGENSAVVRTAIIQKLVFRSRGKR